jgi:hypothetical protein
MPRHWRFDDSLRESFALREALSELCLRGAIGSRPHAESAVCFGAVAVLDIIWDRGLARGERDKIVAHVGYRFHARSAVWFEFVEENVVQTFGKFEFAARGPEKPFP